MIDKPNYYAIIPAEIRYDENLSLLEKFLFAEITALTNKEGYCFASNKYFANLYNRNEKYISSCINKLKKRGYIKVFVDKEKGNFRKIWIGIQKNMDRYSEKPEHPYSEKPEHPYSEKPEHINTSFNTTINNTNNIYPRCFETASIELKNKIKEFVDYRKTIKKPIKTHRPIKSLIENIGKEFVNEKHLIECMDYTMDREYAGVKGEYVKYSKNKEKSRDNVIVNPDHL